jgi:pimeloyl-ACP methyl ester carboxylesterase
MARKLPVVTPPAKARGLSASVKTPPRGRMVDLGDRRIRVVIEGERRDQPLVICEAGAFGTGADFAAIQSALAPRMRLLAYDRAGLGYSEPGPEPRDSRAISDDLKAVLDKLGEPPPYILVGHSMAAVHVQVFALRWPALVKGVVLLDAIPAEALMRPAVMRVAKGVIPLANAARLGSSLMLTALSAPLLGDAIGLSGEPHAEKLRAFASPRHNFWAAKELEHWLDDGEEARSLGEFDRELPLASITAGRSRAWWKRMQAEPARRSRSGYAENIGRAGHASLLGPKHCDAVVRAITFVMNAALASQ